MNVAVQKRSGKRHFIHPDGIATRCGRIIRRSTFRVQPGLDTDCAMCRRSSDNGHSLR